ncbi:MAG: WD40 repeat domain-containing protein [Pseudorhodoplanes sp.]
MAETQNEIPSIADHVQPIAAGAPVVAAHFLDDAAVFVLGEEALLFVDASGEKRVTAHAGGILATASDGKRIVTGGDDGAVTATRRDGATATVARDAKNRWIDQVAVGPGGVMAWSAGKTVFVQNPKGEQRTLDIVSSAGGLAFAPKGVRLAIAHYNGATLWFPNVQGKPETLEWKGSHLGVVFSPDGKFLVTTMQEPMLHGWRLADQRHMRMTGYESRIRSMAWSARGEWLATGGSNQLILWPFNSKDGPMGKSPKMLAPSANRAVTVACHPAAPVVAVGYADGLVMLVRIEDGAEILAKKPGKAAVSALAFSPDGKRMAFGTEDGEAGLLTL